MDTKLYQQLLRYFEGVNKVFRNGSLCFSFEGEAIKLFYYTQGHKHILSTLISISTPKETYYAVQDFCLDCFLENERDKEPLKSVDIALLLGTSEGNARRIIYGIYQKIRTYGKHTVSS